MFVHKKQRWTSLSSLLQRAERFCRSWHSLTSGHETQRLNQHVVSLRSCPCRSRNQTSIDSTRRISPLSTALSSTTWAKKNSAPMVVALWPAKESGQKVADSKASSRHPVILFIFSIFRLMRVFTSDWVKICMFHSSFYETHPQIGWIMLNRYPLHQRKTKWNCSTTLRSCLMATQLFRSKHRFDPAASIQNLKHWYHLKKDWWDVLIVSHLPRKVRKE